jgi:hypothetical protein
MRSVVLIVCLVLAAGAMAEEKPKPRTVVKPVDKSSPVLAATDSSGDTAEAADAKEKANKTKTRAQDYNSSRSNTTSLAGNPESDASDFGMSRAAKRNKGQRGDEASSGQRQSRAQDYNSSRSNISTVAGDARGELGKENRCSIGRLDCDDDGDSVPSNQSCGNGVDNDCDSVDERSAPANHNTTRSNRTQPAVDGDDPVVRKKPGKH